MSTNHLISPDSLTRMSEPWVLLDCRPGAETFATGHLPGAIHADLDRTLSTASDPGFDPAQGGRHPLPEPCHWSKQLGAWGITPETYVVAYDAASGGNGAARLWWMLRASGHTKVVVLNGGLKAAQEIGLVLTQAPSTPTVAPPYPFKSWALPQVDLAAVDTLAHDSTWKLLDVRSPERWRGEVEPFDPIPGRIPGSLNLPWGENLDPTGRFKTPEELRELYQALLDGTPADHLAVHCGSGVTACHTLLALEIAGLPGASIYMGSYSEWCRSGKPLGPERKSVTL
ncbi:MAG: sulfurtransferase [Holophaga sp.]|nr:sulfurtransferase [Holophaga sp.]